MFGIPPAPQNRLDQQFQFMNALSERLSKEMTSTFRGGVPSPVSPFYALAEHGNLFGPYQMGPIGFGLGTAPPQLGSLLSGPIATSLSLMFGGRINHMLQEGGFTPGPIFGRYNPFDMLRNQAVNAGTMEAMQRSQRGDITGISRFLTNMAVIARGPGAVDEAERARIEGFATSGAKHFQAMASPFITMAAMSPALRRVFDTGTLGLFSRAFGGQISAATIAGAAPGLVGGTMGLPPEQVSQLVGGIQKNFFPGGRADLLKTRGFQQTEIADLYSSLARQGAIGTGDLTPAGLSTHKINQQLQSYTKALELVSQVMGPGKSMDQLLQGLNQITGGAVGQISPAQLEHRVNQFQELARSTGVSAGTLMQLTNQGAIFAGQVGVNPAAAGFDSAVGAVTVEAISRDRRRIAGGGIEYGRPAQLARVGALQQRIIGGRASTVGRTVAGIRALARSLSPEGNLAEGMTQLPADVRQAVEDYESGDIHRQARSLGVLRDPSAISAALAKVVPGATASNISGFLRDPMVFGEEQAQEGMPGTIRTLQAQAAERLSGAADQIDIGETIKQLGIQLGQGEKPRDFIFSLGEAFFRAPTNRLGVAAIKDVLKRRGTRNLGGVPALAGVIAADIRNAIGPRNVETTRQVFQTTTPEGRKALQDLSDREALRRIYGETAAGKTVPGNTFSDFIGNIYGYIQSANPDDVDMANVLSRMAGGVPESFANEGDIRRIAEEHGIELEDSEGNDRNIGGVLIDTFGEIRQDMLSNDAGVQKRAEQQFQSLIKGGGSAAAKIYTTAELVQIHKMFGEGATPEEIQRRLKILNEIQKRALGGDTIRKIIGREGGLRRVGRLSKSLTNLAGKLDKFKTAREAGEEIVTAYGRVGSIFKDLKTGELREEFEGLIDKDEAVALATRIEGGITVGKSFTDEDEPLPKKAVKKEQEELRSLSKKLDKDFSPVKKSPPPPPEPDLIESDEKRRRKLDQRLKEAERKRSEKTSEEPRRDKKRKPQTPDRPKKQPTRTKKTVDMGETDKEIPSAPIKKIPNIKETDEETSSDEEIKLWALHRPPTLPKPPESTPDSDEDRHLKYERDLRRQEGDWPEHAPDGELSIEFAEKSTPPRMPKTPESTPDSDEDRHLKYERDLRRQEREKNMPPRMPKTPESTTRRDIDIPGSAGSERRESEVTQVADKDGDVIRVFVVNVDEFDRTNARG